MFSFHVNLDLKKTKRDKNKPISDLNVVCKYIFKDLEIDIQKTIYI